MVDYQRVFRARNPRSPSRGVAAEEGAYIIATTPDDKHVSPAPHQPAPSRPLLLSSLTFNIHDLYLLVDNLIVSSNILSNFFTLRCSTWAFLILNLKRVAR